MTTWPPELKPPVSDEAEKLVLAAILEEPRALERLPDLRPEDFAFKDHKAIFAAMRRLWQAGRPCELLALMDHFRQTGELEGAPKDVEYLRDLRAASWGTVNLDDWAGTIRDYAARRRLFSLGKEIAERAAEVTLDDSAEIAGDALAQLSAFQSASGTRRVDARTIREAEAEAMAQPLRAHSTGFRLLDRAMGGGLVAGRAYGIAARFKIGKTALAGTISRHLNRAGVKHLYVACEMGGAEIERRSMAVDLSVNSLAFVDGVKRGDVEFRRRVAELAIKTPRNAIYLDAPGLTFDRLRREVESAVAVDHIAGIFLDYLQLIGGKAKGTTTAEHLDAVAQWIADTTRKRGIWAVVLSQLNQEGNTRGGEAPLLAFDQVYRLEREPDGGTGAWLEILATRFTPWFSVGSAERPALRLNESVGPFFEEISYAPVEGNEARAERSAVA